MKKFGLLLSILLFSCNEPTLVPLDRSSKVSLDYIDVDAKFCTAPRNVAKQKIKYLFILDHSQSNQPGFADPLTPTDVTSTDPVGARRYGPLVQFINNLESDPNNLTYFSLIDFENIAYSPPGLDGFVSDPDAFVNHFVKPDWIGRGTSSVPSPNDKGFTNYMAALQSAFNIIKADAQSEALLPSNPVITTTYQIIFVSDGIPTVATAPGSPSLTYTQNFLSDLSPLISNIINLKSDTQLAPFIAGISFNTAYYYQNVAVVAAQTLLEQMSVAGNGQYLEFGLGQNIAYQSFVPAIRSIKYNLSEIWLENQNVIGWDEGQLLVDSDADGLPNLKELEMGSDPYKADSDGNGVSDLVEYRTKGKPCNDAKCSPARRDPYSICDGFSPSGTAGSIVYPWSSGDGLNDCEKFVLGANRDNFDSNADFIPDLLSFKNSIPFISGTSGAFLNPFGDALDNYAKLKLGYPVTVSQRNLKAFEPRVITLTHLSTSSSDTECYRYLAKHVAVLQAGNSIQISVIENNALIDNKPILVVGTKKWNGRERVIFFNQEEFK
ncbi:MAG: hypothetical protein H7333_08125 [Bdellovibrionales bacterium]|nr:hypothetical protein [Oligoflexia bacterium]